MVPYARALTWSNASHKGNNLRCWILFVFVSQDSIFMPQNVVEELWGWRERLIIRNKINSVDSCLYPLFVRPFHTIAYGFPNEQGCLHHKLRRHHVALHYFQKALQALGKEDSKASVGNGKASGGGASWDCGRDSQVAPAPICEVLYNTGLQLLVTENPEEVCVSLWYMCGVCIY